MVDLGKVGRLERHADVEFRQRVGQLAVQRVERHHRVRALGLEPELHAVLVGEGTQQRLVGFGQRHEDAQHQHGHILPHRQLDLRQAVADRQTRDQPPQRHQQGRYMRRQHFAARHIGHIAALSLMEADQRQALLRHVAHRQPRPVAITPIRAGDRAEHHVRAQLRKVPEIVLQHALLDSHLRARIQVLHRTTATYAKVLAARLHAHRRGFLDRAQVCLLETGLALEAAVADGLARQRALDENHLAWAAVLIDQPANAARLHVEAVDLHDGQLHGRRLDRRGHGRRDGSATFRRRMGLRKSHGLRHLGNLTYCFVRARL